tara:strand:+ start:475 stop:654 length:180 start_codon:yes stop_codon:yes gene_type:complete
MNKVKDLLKSRRFWASVGGVVVILLQDVLGLEATTANSIVAVVVSWVVGDSLRSTKIEE